MDDKEVIFNKIKSGEMTSEEFAELIRAYGIECYDDGYDAARDQLSDF